MGIAKGAYSLLAELKRDYSELGGAVLQLGKQTTFLNASQMESSLKKIGVSSAIDLNSRVKSSEHVDDVYLFNSLGFECVDSMDYSDYEGATYIHDFNQPVPEQFHQKYDAIYDGGTLEHIFDFPQSLRNIFKMLKVGGVVIHSSPSSNHVDHGFYMFSPTVFYDWYSANGFEIIKSYIFEYQSDHAGKPWKIYQYHPGSIQHLSFGGWGGEDKLLGIYFVARKIRSSTCNLIPQQGAYIRTWSGYGVTPGDSPHFPNSEYTASKVFTKIKSFVKKNDLLLSFLLPAYKRFLSKRKPRVIAEY